MSALGTMLDRLLRGYYWYMRPVLVLAYGGLLLLGKRMVHPLDLLLLLTLWLLPLWVRLRLLPASKKRDPPFAAELAESLQRIDGQRAASKLPWVRARP